MATMAESTQSKKRKPEADASEPKKKKRKAPKRLTPKKKKSKSKVESKEKKQPVPKVNWDRINDNGLCDDCSKTKKETGKWPEAKMMVGKQNLSAHW